MQQEIWITIRVKGYADAAHAADKVADAAGALACAALAVRNPSGFLAHDLEIMEIEQEADIYEQEARDVRT